MHTKTSTNRSKSTFNVPQESWPPLEENEKSKFKNESACKNGSLFAPLRRDRERRLGTSQSLSHETLRVWEVPAIITQFAMLVI